MKIFSIKGKNFIPASHEDPINPGALKIVLCDTSFINSNQHLQMINWAKLPLGKSFEPHYHEDMDEIFIIMEGKCEMQVDTEKEIIEKGEGTVVSARSIHTMKNIGANDCYYLAIGFSEGKNGKTVNAK